MSVKKLLVACASAAALAVFPASALANTVSISGSMEGAIQIANGDSVAAGYQFSLMGAHPEAHVLMANASVTFTGTCSNGSPANTLSIPLRSGAAGGGPYDIAVNDTSTHPGTNEQDAVSYQGSVTASVCGGTGQLDASKGATFSADLKSDVTANDVHVQFHYRDPNAKGKGNYDCSASNYSADKCGASWSGTASLKPSPLPTCGPGQTMDANGNCVTPPPPTCPPGQTMGANGQCTTPPNTPPTVTPPPTTPPATTTPPAAGTPAPAGGVSPSRVTVKPKARPKPKAKKHKKAKRVRHRAAHRRIVPHFTG